MHSAAASRLAPLGVLAILVTIVVTGIVAPAAAEASRLCGTMAGSPSARYRHVVVIMDENKSFSDIIGPRGSSPRRHPPSLNPLARMCGLATNYRGKTHPSHPNYMAIPGGIPAVGSSE